MQSTAEIDRALSLVFKNDPGLAVKCFTVKESATLDSIATTLKNHEANIHFHLKDHESPLRMAAWSEMNRSVRALLDKGADAIDKNADGYSPPMSADPSATRLLIEHGTDVDARNYMGLRPLHLPQLRPG